MKQHKNHTLVMEYARSITEGRKIACRELKQGCERFLRDLENPAYDFNPKDAEFVIQIIEKTLCHVQGEKLDGTPLRGTSFLLEPFHKFQIYNLLGFYHKGTNIRRFKEAFIFIPRKNIKTSFAAALSWALGLLERRSGSKVYIVSAALKQSLESFNFILYNLGQMGEKESFRILDNIIKEAMKAYTNKLMIGITTAGDDMTSFCYQRLQYCKKILDGTVSDEAYFVFICKADEDENGDVDFTNPLIHEMANPAYGVSIHPDDILNDAMQALNDPQQRKDFFAKFLNVYTAAMKAYFNLDEFQRSDAKFQWTIEQLARLPVEWYGGADLSKLHDLTAAALYGTLKDYDFDRKKIDVDIIIPHAWFPIVASDGPVFLLDNTAE